MKVIVTVDCSPEEARAFLGLPDVRPLQAAVLDRVQGQLLDAIGATSPEALLRVWAPLAPQSTEAMREAMLALFRPFLPATPASGAAPGPPAAAAPGSQPR